MRHTADSDDAHRCIFFSFPTLDLLHTTSIYSVIPGITPETLQHDLATCPPLEESGPQAVWHILHDPRRRLAWHLLSSSQADFSFAQHINALWVPKARLQRTQHLLRYAEAQEQTGCWSSAREVWKWVDREWHWAATAPAMKQWLGQYAHAWGVLVSEIEPLVQSVLDAITGELLPVLHMKWYLLASESQGGHLLRADHQAYLDQWQPTLEVSDGLAWVYLWYLAARHKDGAPFLHAVLPKVLTLFQGKHVTVQTTTQLAKFLAHWLITDMSTGLATESTSPAINTWLTPLERLEQVAPPNFTLMKLLARAYLTSSERALAEQKSIPEAVKNLSRAFAYDPFNPQVRQTMLHLEQWRNALQQRLPTLAAHDQGHVGEILQSIETSLQEAVALDATSHVQHLSTRRHQALQIEFAQRLKLTPYDASTAALLDAFIACMHEASSLNHNPTSLSAQLQQVALTQGSQLAMLDWEAIEQATTHVLEDGPVPRIERFVLALPSPPPFSLDAVVDPSREAVQRWRTQRTIVGDRRSVGLLAGTWMFSSVDLPLKALVLAGLLLCLHGALLTVRHRNHTDVLNQAYRHMLASRQQGNDAALIQHAMEFLQGVSSDPHDPRVPQSVLFLKEAALHTAIRLITTGSEEAATTLLHTVRQMTERLTVDTTQQRTPKGRLQP